MFGLADRIRLGPASLAEGRDLQSKCREREVKFWLRQETPLNGRIRLRGERGSVALVRLREGSWGVATEAFFVPARGSEKKAEERIRGKKSRVGQTQISCPGATDRPPGTWMPRVCQLPTCVRLKCLRRAQQ